MNLEALTDEQRLVVTHGDGPAVVIACPGSGKTRALTHRMGYLIEQRVSPFGILGITFTRAAANEMKQRLAGLIHPDKAKQVRLHTFHALAYHIVTEIEGRPNVLGEREQRAMAGQLLREFQLNADQTAVESLLTDFAFFVGAQVPVDQCPLNLEPQLFVEIWTRYGELKAEAGVSDFDDLIVRARDLLRENPEHQQRQVRRTQYLMVDEFQDTNALQWQLLQLLVPEKNNMMVVGDDDQAIYGWRGASPSFMLDFPQAFPECSVLRLTRNFRSTASIIKPAEKLIAVNSQRFDKSFIAERPPTEPPTFVRPASAAEEADEIVTAVRDRLESGANPAGLAVLYRTHLLGYPLMNRLERAGIPFRVIGGRPNPFTRWMARDVLAYLRWAYGEASLDEIARVLRRPSRRGISKDLATEMIQQQVAPGDVLDWLSDRVPPVGIRELHTLGEDLTTLVTCPAGSVVSYIRSEIGYEEYIDLYCEWSGSDPEEAREVLGAIEQVPDPNEKSRVYLELAEQAEHRTETDDPTTPALTLASFHSSKGLEWDQVWLLSAVEGAIPHRKTILGKSQSAMEEERRLFYVGLTRAKESVIVSAPRNLLGADVIPSRFAREAGIWTPVLPKLQPRPHKPVQAGPQPVQPQQGPLPPALLREDYAPGIICYHAKFGDGVIHRVYESRGIVEVRFRQPQVTKTLSIDTCVGSGLLRGPRQ